VRHAFSPYRIVTALAVVTLLAVATVGYLSWRINRVVRDQLVSDVASREALQPLGEFPAMTGLTRQAVEEGASGPLREQYRLGVAAASLGLLKVRTTSPDPQLRLLAERLLELGTEIARHEGIALEQSARDEGVAAIGTLEAAQYLEQVERFRGTAHTMVMGARSRVEEATQRVSDWTYLILAVVSLIAVALLVLWALTLRMLRRFLSENLLLIDRLETTSTHDRLTGLLNRHGFLVQAERVWAREQWVGVIFADLDGLKQINDSLGHLAGDAALAGAAEILRRMFRAQDLIGRLGGDEFVVLLPGGLPDDPTNLERRLDGAAKGFPALGEVPTLSISIGAIEVSTEAVSLDRALRDADGRMYERKRDRKGLAGPFSIEAAPSAP
jgi:diguanylate cyclase (GGDEF)-like protein